MSRVSKSRLLVSTFLFIATSVSSLIATQLHASPSENEASGTLLSLPAENFEFSYGSQSGGFTGTCRHEMNSPVLKDWDVVCGNESDPDGVHRFTVHFRIWFYLKSEAPKITYNVHFWVTNHQAKVGSGGRFVGSTLYFHLDDITALRILDITQDVEDTNMLRAKIKL